MFRLNALAFVLVLAAPCAAACDPDLNNSDDDDRLNSATFACMTYETPAQRSECDQVPALIQRIRTAHALHSSEEGHEYMSRELVARKYYGTRLHTRGAGAMKGRGAPPVRIANAEEANFRDGLALIDGDLAKPGHGHAVTDNLEFLLEAANFYLTLGRYDVIDPWLARVRAELQPELISAPPGATERPWKRYHAQRVARVAGWIETAWSDSLANRAKRSAAGGNAGAAARQTSAASEAQALARRWESRAEALDDDAATN